MRNLALLASFACALAACAHFSNTPLAPGLPVDALRSALGKPTAEYHAGAETVLEFATGPSGKVTYMARIGADQRLISYEQVLTAAKFATIGPGVDTTETVLHGFGRPAEVSHLNNPPYEVWSYRYKELDVWDSMMYVHFTPSGVVAKLVNGPDPEREARWR